MVCIYCNGSTSITNSRAQKRTNSTWRRHECQNCKAVFTTVEKADYSRSFVFKDPQGRFEPFNRLKLLISLYESLKHRKTALKDAEALCSTIIIKVIEQSSDGAVKRDDLVGYARKVLGRFDSAAEVHYSAYHK